jgi:hypothetical protein
VLFGSRLPREARRTYDTFDLLPMKVKVESHKREPLAGIPGAGDRMGRDDFGRIQPCQGRGERFKERLIALDRYDPIGQGPPASWRRDVRSLLAWRPRLRNDLLDRLTAMDWFSSPDPLPVPYALGGGPHAIDRTLFRKHEVLDVLGDAPLAGVGLERALGRRQVSNLVEQASARRRRRSNQLSYVLHRVLTLVAPGLSEAAERHAQRPEGEQHEPLSVGA